MKKVLKVLAVMTGVLFGVVAIAIGVFYVGWLRHPSAEQVCDNVRAISDREVPKGTMYDALNKDCVTKMQAPDHGLITYASRMKCYDKAKTLTELQSCSREG